MSIIIICSFLIITRLTLTLPLATTCFVTTTANRTVQFMTVPGFLLLTILSAELNVSTLSPLGLQRAGHLFKDVSKRSSYKHETHFLTVNIRLFVGTRFCNVVMYRKCMILCPDDNNDGQGATFTPIITLSD